MNRMAAAQEMIRRQQAGQKRPDRAAGIRTKSGRRISKARPGDRLHASGMTERQFAEMPGREVRPRPELQRRRSGMTGDVAPGTEFEKTGLTARDVMTDSPAYQEFRGRPKPTVATPEQAVVTRGAALQPEEKPMEKRLEDIAVKKAMRQPLSEDDLRTEYQAARQQPMGPTAPQVSPDPYMDPEFASLSQEQISMMSPADQARYQQNIQFAQQARQRDFDMAMTPEQYMQMSPEEQRQFQQQAFDEYGAQREGMLEEAYGLQQQTLADRLERQEGDLDAQRTEIQAENDKLLADFEDARNRQDDKAIAEVMDAAREAQTEIKNMMARRGFGRSSATATQLSKASARTQDIIADIEATTGEAISSYQAQLVDRLDRKLEKYENRLDQTQDAKDALELQKVQEKIQLTKELFTQDPSNPQNIMQVAEKLQQQKIESDRATQEATAKNFKYMLETFGSDFIRNMSPEGRANYANALGMNPGDLENIGLTQGEQDRNWDMLQYQGNQEFEMQKMVLGNQQQIDMALMNHGFDVDLLDRKNTFQVDLMNLENQIEQDKMLSKWSGIVGGLNKNYGNVAINADPNAMTLGAPVPHPGANVPIQSINMELAGAYPEGYRFKASEGPAGLGGQCLWYAQQLTKLDGKNWSIGNTIGQKKKNFEKYRDKGQAFRPGEDQIQVGMTILTNESPKWGHGAVVNAITPDGKLVLSESNFKGPLTVSNSRIIDPTDPKIFGVVRTQPSSKYKLGKSLISAVEKSALKKGLSPLGKIGGMLGRIGEQIPGAAQRGMQTLQQRQVDEQQAAYEEANKPENIISQNPFLASIASGAKELTDEERMELSQVSPEFYGLAEYAANMAKQQAGVAEEAAPMTQSQSDAAMYASRIQESGNIINRLEQDVMAGGPAGMIVQRNLPNFMKTDTQRQVEQAQRNFINAVLRRESGAAIAPEEFTSADLQYFPQPGDDPGTLDQKRRNRELALQGLLLGTTQAGRDYVSRLATQQPMGVPQPMQLSAQEQQSIFDQL